jgi:hypothetical protein
VTYVRHGSKVVEGAPGPVDIYAVSPQDGRNLATIYLCAYHKRISRKAPRGFTWRNTPSRAGATHINRSSMTALFRSAGVACRRLGHARCVQAVQPAKHVPTSCAAGRTRLAYDCRPGGLRAGSPPSPPPPSIGPAVRRLRRSPRLLGPGPRADSQLWPWQPCRDRPCQHFFRSAGALG